MDMYLIELEFENVGLCGGRKTEVSRAGLSLEAGNWLL